MPGSSFQGKAVLSVEELATYLGVSRGTAYGLVHRGQIRFKRVGRRILIPLSAVEEFLNGEREEEVVAHARR
ncbi:MAG: DNA-binding protein [Aquificota bacterium]|nr:MAG: DNA-binding protein [Aquificota bacterium]